MKIYLYIFFVISGFFCVGQSAEEDPSMDLLKQEFFDSNDVILVAVYKTTYRSKANKENRAELRHFARVVQVLKGNSFKVGDLVNYREWIEFYEIKNKETREDSVLQYLFVSGAYKKNQEAAVEATDLWFEHPDAQGFRMLLKELIEQDEKEPGNSIESSK